MTINSFERVDPPPAAPEHETLTAFLDYHRATLLRKFDGLNDAALRCSIVPSGITLLGMVKHLAQVERWWFHLPRDGSLPGATEPVGRRT